MAALRSVKNQYRGINAHLHSSLQAEGGWDSFHANHIADLMRLMSAQLLPMGYVADIQQSLQIRRLGESAGKPESDVTIFDPDQTRTAKTFHGTTVPGLALTSVMSTESELAPYSAVSIYEYVRGERDPGEPVAWVELLSPSNKPGGQDAVYYQDKRLKLLRSGIVFVELDYLHESPPTFDRLPRYNGSSKQSVPELDAHPYRIVVVDPRPVFHEGTVYPHDFDVDREIPVVDIPLNANDVLKFDFQTAYNKTFSETLYGMRLVDYSQLPLNFDRYSRDDQVRILARMLVVMDAARQELDLEAIDILPTEPVPLDEALSQLKRWK
jgi:Protein of unknown function (DUF4058)